MNEDIVTRLKNAEHVGPNGTTKLNIAQLLLNRAAVKEIERLRQLLWKYENCEMVREVPCEPDWVGGECDTCKEHHRD